MYVCRYICRYSRRSSKFIRPFLKEHIKCYYNIKSTCNQEIIYLPYLFINIRISFTKIFKYAYFYILRNVKTVVKDERIYYRNVIIK